MSSTARATSTPLPSVAPPFYASLPHHVSGKFRSPWPSAAPHGFVRFLRARLTEWNEGPLPGAEALAALSQGLEVPSAEEMSGRVGVTWLGHASSLLSLPHSSGVIRVLLDPVFAPRCSPLSFAGPARFTAAPTTVGALLDATGGVDVVAISHNHYDHLCVPTLRALVAAQTPLPHFVVPLGLAAFIRSMGVPAENVTELDWWGRALLSLPPLSSPSASAAPATTSAPSSSGDKEEEAAKRQLRITCTPAQHFSGRGAFDRDATLWAGFAFEAVPSNGDKGANVWFAGDSGYRTVPGEISREEEEKLPYCPAFEEIGQVLGPFDLALIPIGAYTPRSCMSTIHMAPHESVAVHKAVRARRSLGIHWGVFRLTPEDVLEPRELLREEAKRQGLGEREFETCGIGATLFAEVGEK